VGTVFATYLQKTKKICSPCNDKFQISSMSCYNSLQIAMPLLDVDVITNAVHNLVGFLGIQDLALGSSKACVGF
jgi:hypothetical protein